MAPLDVFLQVAPRRRPETALGAAKVPDLHVGRLDVHFQREVRRGGEMARVALEGPRVLVHGLPVYRQMFRPRGRVLALVAWEFPRVLVKTSLNLHFEFQPVLVAEFQSSSEVLPLQKFYAMLRFIKLALVRAALYFFSLWVFSLISLVAILDFILWMY